MAVYLVSYIYSLFAQSLSLSVLMAIFPGEPGLTRFIGAKGDGSDGDIWSYKMCKAPDNSSPPINQHPSFYRLNVLPVKTLNGKYHVPLTCSPQPYPGLPTLSLTTKDSWFGRRLPCFLSAL